MIKTPTLARGPLLPYCLSSLRTPSHVLAITGRYRQPQLYSTDSRTRRRIHGSSTRSSAPAADRIPLPASSPAGGLPINGEATPVSASSTLGPAPLSVLPLATVLRSLGSTTISSSRVLLPPSLAIMSMLAYSDQAILNPDKNPFLRWFLKKTFYAQFCAGENATEVRRTIDGLKDIGYTGVILGYAKEVVLTDGQTRDLSSCGEGPMAEECIRNEIIPWATGTLETLRLAQPGDFVAIKFSGAGRQALYALKNRLPPSVHLKKAIDEICDLAAERDVPVLFDAEQTAIQAGIDDWTLEYQRKYNTKPGHAIIYGTYQAYLKATPALLGSQLAVASKEGFTLGIKLVRGAYLGTDPRHIIHDTKADTDAAYDGIAASLIKRQWGPVLQQDVAFPQVSILLGSHNRESVCKARKIRSSPECAGTELAIAQLQGMADEVSCELLVAKAADKTEKKTGQTTTLCGEAPRAYKYIVWGTTKECMKYLLRRAHENKDAVSRTKSGRDAAWGEVKRRARALVGLA
ncbi:putative proline dehydrogenase [Rosellinia necatrix]|uniref:Proline dehydrogenase n=1 Tax=Rosellinia necatrix TaxID=77044 RepID=A0A1W2TC08_ROSNE|nr:putative proline dehydrogenase [Rosellinia necatrix]